LLELPPFCLCSVLFIVRFSRGNRKKADVKKMGEACLNSATYNTAFLSNLHSASTWGQQFAWYVLKIRTGGELAAVTALRHRDYTPYCPMQKVRRHYSDRMKIVDAAAFPGYVFCQFDSQKKLPIISCPGVEYIVGFADGPTPIPEEELMNVRRMIDAGASAVRGMEQGQRVRVTHGPLEGVEGILVRDATSNRLVVSIELLNQGASLHINQDEVCPVGQDQSKAHLKI
jgi:transcription antitermination factor NusG